ncbi:CBS domain-containing protein [Nocardia donostiensis]|uniref:CBS domain-containing protein n=1 Tax=Nocardia donostiensis TaxID=1538463 RepID=A0A1W0AS98_9NOCA|nr:CBS domain-containing protein [Nocardia donostiensis]ONM47977.1 CBS domain-containing protein [Nocardia donostiensis]OQS13110.1 CBS domain-containing protein [Nocardia donostiensis]OQS21521.1 CBS domain-containing protein [Nocardia donostiensis]
MSTAKSVMHEDVVSIGVRDTLDVAAQQMRQRDIGSLLICDGEGHPVGIVTDRDIVVNCLALGRNPSTATAGEFAQGDELRTVDVGTDMAEALALMQRYQVRRLPVTEQGKVVGIITEADLARGMPELTVGEFVGSVCEHKLPARTGDNPQ